MISLGGAGGAGAQGARVAPAERAERAERAGRAGPAGPAGLGAAGGGGVGVYDTPLMADALVRHRDGIAGPWVGQCTTVPQSKLDDWAQIARWEPWVRAAVFDFELVSNLHFSVPRPNEVELLHVGFPTRLRRRARHPSGREHDPTEGGASSRSSSSWSRCTRTCAKTARRRFSRSSVRSTRSGARSPICIPPAIRRRSSCSMP